MNYWPTVLIVDDSPEMTRLLTGILGDLCRPLSATSGSEALVYAQNEHLDLIILDVSMPDEDGFKIFAKLRSVPKLSLTPILFLSGKTEIADQLTGYTLGADDYLVKPIEPQLFRAKIRAKLQNQRPQDHRAVTLIRSGSLEIDPQRLKAHYLNSDQSKTDLDLTRHELRLLIYFYENEELVLSRQQILDAVWGHDVHVLDRTIDRHVSTLRKKLKSSEHKIDTVYGAGYRFSSVQTQVTSKAA